MFKCNHPNMFCIADERQGGRNLCRSIKNSVFDNDLAVQNMFNPPSARPSKCPKLLEASCHILSQYGAT